jgi:uroporphyrinogen-III synthase
LGAEVIALPVIEIQAPADPAPLARAMAQLETYDWIIFTSVNGVRRFVSSLEDIRKLRAKIAAIGPATQAAVEALHLKADIVPAEYVAESLLDALAGEDLKGRRILLPRAAVARDVVPAELAKRGAIVDVAEAYRTEATAGLAERAREVLARKPHWITFTSSSTVKNFASVASVEGMKIASIGPITSATARELGMHVDVEADPHTMAGLVAAIQSK